MPNFFYAYGLRINNKTSHRFALQRAPVKGFKYCLITSCKMIIFESRLRTIKNEQRQTDHSNTLQILSRNFYCFYTDGFMSNYAHYISCFSLFGGKPISTKERCKMCNINPPPPHFQILREVYFKKITPQHLIVSKAS